MIRRAAKTSAHRDNELAIARSALVKWEDQGLLIQDGAQGMLRVQAENTQLKAKLTKTQEVLASTKRRLEASAGDRGAVHGDFKSLHAELQGFLTLLEEPSPIKGARVGGAVTAH